MTRRSFCGPSEESGVAPLPQNTSHHPPKNTTKAVPRNPHNNRAGVEGDRGAEASRLPHLLAHATEPPRWSGARSSFLPSVLSRRWAVITQSTSAELYLQSTLRALRKELAVAGRWLSPRGGGAGGAHPRMVRRQLKARKVRFLPLTSLTYDLVINRSHYCTRKSLLSWPSLRCMPGAGLTGSSSVPLELCPRGRGFPHPDPPWRETA